MKPNCLTVCVEFADLLGITLPRNRHHFDQMLIVTAHKDRATHDLAYANDCLCYCTDAFYRQGADFNKWLALEEGLDILGREGWLCLLDADVILPHKIPWLSHEPPLGPTVGKLYTPLRRMLETWPIGPASDCKQCQGNGWVLIPTQPAQEKEAADGLRVWETKSPCPSCSTRTPLDSLLPSLQEDQWWQYPTHRNIYEWAGYCQIFHASDPALGPPPWHETDWKHAGGADSTFQRKWKPLDKIRPQFECLHLGPAGQNWCGRATPLLDGTVLPDAEGRQMALRHYFSGRRRSVGMGGKDPYAHEKLGR